MNTQTMTDTVKTLTGKAAQAHDSSDAMRFAQAATSVANAFRTLADAVKAMATT